MGDLHSTEPALASNPVRRRRRWLWATLAVTACGLTLGVIEGLDRVQESADRSR